MKSTGRNVLPTANAGETNTGSTVAHITNAGAKNTANNAVPLISAGAKKIVTASTKRDDNFAGRRGKQNRRRRSNGGNVQWEKSL
jgi:hypothetical protein